MPKRLGLEAYVLMTVVMIVGGFMGGLALTPGGLSAPVDEFSVRDTAAPGYKGARLLVVELESCGWCVKFRETIGPWYVETGYQRKAPLTYVNFRRQRSSGYTLARPVNSTPTVVVVDAEGQERARFRGYPGNRNAFLKFLDQSL